MPEKEMTVIRNCNILKVRATKQFKNLKVMCLKTMLALKYNGISWLLLVPMRKARASPRENESLLFEDQPDCNSSLSLPSSSTDRIVHKTGEDLPRSLYPVF